MGGRRPFELNSSFLLIASQHELRVYCRQCLSKLCMASPSRTNLFSYYSYGQYLVWLFNRIILYLNFRQRSCVLLQVLVSGRLAEVPFENELGCKHETLGHKVLCQGPSQPGREGQKRGALYLLLAISK